MTLGTKLAGKSLPEGHFPSVREVTLSEHSADKLRVAEERNSR